MDWRGIVWFYLTSLVICVAASLAARKVGWSVGTTGWSVAGTLIMFTPALGRWVATRAADNHWVAPFSLSTWGSPRVSVVLIPAITELTIYLASYAIAMSAGRAHWQPAWPPGRVAANLAVNLPLLIVIGAIVSTGEEWGWRGYLQPRLEDMGVKNAFVLVGILWALFHIPIMAFAGYERTPWGRWGFALFTITCLCDSYIWWRACVAANSLYPAIWFHTFHNIASQWLLPRLFQTSSPALLGEHGALPVALHVVAAVALAWLVPSAAPGRTTLSP